MSDCSLQYIFISTFDFCSSEGGLQGLNYCKYSVHVTHCVDMWKDFLCEPFMFISVDGVQICIALCYVQLILDSFAITLEHQVNV